MESEDQPIIAATTTQSSTNSFTTVTQSVKTFAQVCANVPDFHSISDVISDSDWFDFRGQKIDANVSVFAQVVDKSEKTCCTNADLTPCFQDFNMYSLLEECTSEFVYNVASAPMGVHNTRLSLSGLTISVNTDVKPRRNKRKIKHRVKVIRKLKDHPKVLILTKEQRILLQIRYKVACNSLIMLRYGKRYLAKVMNYMMMVTAGIASRDGLTRVRTNGDLLNWLYHEKVCKMREDDTEHTVKDVEETPTVERILQTVEEKPTLITNMFSGITKSMDSVNNIAENGIKVNIPELSKVGDDFRETAALLKDEITALRKEVTGMKDMKVEVNHSFKDYLPDKLTKPLEGFFEMAKGALPTDPRARTMSLIILYNVAVYVVTDVWKKNGWNLSKIIFMVLAYGFAHYFEDKILERYIMATLAFEVGSSLFKTIIDYCTANDTEDEEEEEEEDSTKLITNSMEPGSDSWLRTILQAISLAMFGHDIYAGQDPRLALKGYSSTTKSLTDLITNIYELFVKTVNFASSATGIRILRTQMNLNPTLFEIASQFEELKAKAQKGDLKVKDYSDKYLPTVKKLNNIHPSILSNSNNHATGFVSYLRQMEKYLDLTFKLEGLIKDRTRCRPYKVIIASKPRRGKTLLTTAATNICAKLYFDEEEYQMFSDNRSSIVHNLKLSREFQDGLTNHHKIYVIDDFLQSRNKTEEPSKCEGVKFTAIDGNEPEMANMAFNKGEVFCEPYAIVANTNLMDFDNFKHGMLDATAFQYRVSDNLFTCELKPEYRRYYNPDKPDGDDYIFDEEKYPDLTTDAYVIKHFTYIGNGQTKQTVPVCKNVYNYEQWSKYIGIKALNWQVKEEANVRTLLNLRKNKDFFIFHNMSRDQAIMDLMMNPCVDDNGTPMITLKDPEYSMTKALEGKNANEIIEPFLKFSSLLYLVNSLPKLEVARSIDDILCDDMEFLEKVVSAMSIYFDVKGNHERLEALKTVVKNLNNENYFRKPWLESNDLFEKRREEFLGKVLSRDEEHIASFFPLKPKVEKKKSRFSEFRDMISKYIPTEVNLFDKMVDTDPEFVKYVEEKKPNLIKWFKGEDYKFKDIISERFFDPRSDIFILWNVMKKLFVTSMRVMREFSMIFSDIIGVLTNSKWTDVMKDSMGLIRRRITNIKENIYSYLETSFYGLFVGLAGPVLLGAAVGVAIGTYVNFIKTNSEMITNSMLAIKFRPGRKLRTGAVARKAVVARDVKNNAHPIEKGASKEGVTNAYEPKMNHIDVINKTIPSNMFTLLKQTPKGWLIVEQLLFLRGRTAVMNEHAYLSMKDYFSDVPDAQIRLMDYFNNTQDFFWKDCRFTIFSERDLVLVTFPRQFMQKPTIINNFVKDEELPKTSSAYENLSFVLAYMTLEDNGVRYLNRTPVQAIGDTFTYASPKGDFKKTQYGFVYNVCGHESSCISPLLMADHRLPDTYRICALHCSGSSKGARAMGAGVVVTQELLEEMLSHSYEELKPVLKVRDPEMVTNAFPVSKFPCYGTVKHFYNNEFNAIKKSRFYGFMGDEVEPKVPTPLQAYEVETPDGTKRFDPILQALEQYCQPMPAINQDLLDLSLAMFLKRWEDNSLKPVTYDVWDKTRIIEGDGIVGPDKRDTSAGPQFKLRGIKMTDLYGFEGPRLKEVMPPLFDEIWAEFEDICSELEEGIVPNFKYLGFLKSETVKKSKILTGKSRYISGPDKFSIWAKRKYFGSLVSASIKNGYMNGFLTGLNPYSQDWDGLAKIFAKIYMHVYDGDFKNFDGHLGLFLFSVFSQFCRHIFSHQEEKYHRARDALIWDMANSIHYVPCSTQTEEEVEAGVKEEIAHFIIKWLGSLPSGDFLTQLFGTFSNHILINYNRLMSWVKSKGLTVGEYSLDIHPKPHIDRLVNEMAFFALSDDHLIGVRQLIPGWNPKVIKENYAEMGCKYTAADKEAEVTEDWKSIFDCMLLRRFFVLGEDGRIIAPIEDGSIYNSLYWTECKDKNLDLVIKTAKQELSLKTQEWYYYVLGKLKAWAEKIHYKLPAEYNDYWSTRKRVLNSSYAPWGDDLLEI